jgi:hypothetical protein
MQQYLFHLLPKNPLAVFKSFTSVQVEPFQDSVFPVAAAPELNYPPKARAEVLLAPAR